MQVEVEKKVTIVLDTIEVEILKGYLGLLSRTSVRAIMEIAYETGACEKADQASDLLTSLYASIANV